MGHNEYGLKSLADDQLLSGLASIVHRRNQITAEFLAYLAALDERQLFLDLGFSSLFEYCVVKLGLCESTAGRHIAAARVCRNHPEVFAMVASGALHASALSLLRKHLTPENAGELFELCSRQSMRKVEELLAVRFPRADVRDLVRRLPARAVGTLNVERLAQPTPKDVCMLAPTTEPAKAPFVSRDLSAESEKMPVESLLHATAVRESTEAAKSRRIEPLAADRYGVHFTANGEFCALLERVRGLAGHRLPSGDLMTLLKRGLEAYERELEKERFGVGRKTRRNRNVVPESGALPAPDHSAPADPTPSHSTPNRSVPERRAPERSASEVPEPATSTPEFSSPTLVQSDASPNLLTNSTRKRHLPAAVVQAVFLRDGKQCSYVSLDGRRCGARRCLELDHIEPLAVGGEDTIENLRLRCRAHNQRYARQYFGSSRVEAAIKRCRKRREARRGVQR